MGIVTPIILARHMGQKRIGKEWKAVRRALSIVPEIAY
jgi:hypothetical protein